MWRDIPQPPSNVIHIMLSVQEAEALLDDLLDYIKARVPTHERTLNFASELKRCIHHGANT